MNSENKLNKNNSTYFNVLVFAIIIFFLWLFNRNYITSLLSGFIVASLTFPIFHHLKNYFELKTGRNYAPAAAISTIALVSVFLLILINIFWHQLIPELVNLRFGFSDFVNNLPRNESLKNFLNLSTSDAENLAIEINYQTASLEEKLSDRSGFFIDIVSLEKLPQTIQRGQKTLNQIVEFIVQITVFVLAWFNALLLGLSWVKNLFEILPLSFQEKNQIEKDLKLGIRNVVYANLLAGIIHAVTAFLIMLVFGIQNKFIITSLVFFVGMLPMSPSELGYSIPLFFIFQANPVAALFLIPICEIIILWVNYVLTPRIISDGESGNPLLILTSLLSGIGIFGIMGFVIAPVIMILIQSLYKILLQRLKTLN